MSPHIQLIVIGLIGVLFHSLVKLNSLATDARAANVQFHPIQDYVVKDVWALLLSFTSVLAWYLLFEEVSARYPALLGFTRVSFFVMGFMGSYLLQLALGRAKGTLRKIVDAKTTMYDGTTEATTPLTKQAATDIRNGE